MRKLLRYSVEPLIALTIGFVAVITAAAILGFGLRRVLQDPTGARQYRRFVVLPSLALIGLLGFW